VFSANETIFKCLYPQVGRYFDFRDAVVTALDPAGRFSAHLLSALTPALPSGFALEGRFVRDATSVCTAMVLAVSQR
jgi:enterobactin synthetase component D